MTTYRYQAHPNRRHRFFKTVSVLGEAKNNEKNLKYALSERFGFCEAFCKGYDGKELAKRFEKHILGELRRAKILSNSETIMCMFSFMDTERGTCSQKPHIDFPTWDEVLPGGGGRRSRSIRPPLLLFFPLTSSG